MDCPICNRLRPPHRSGMCFSCWIGAGKSGADGIKVNWVGGEGYGRAAFHDMTYSEAIACHKPTDPTREYEPRHSRAGAWAPVK